MPELNISKRWYDPGFFRDAESLIDAVFSRKSAGAPVDLRGIIVGMDGALPRLLTADFQDLHGDGIDASGCKVSCSFSRARIGNSKFENSLFDTCRFKEAEFDHTSFDAAKFDSPTFDDAKFVQCSFVGAKITGRRLQEYGGRRFVFEGCDFRLAIFRNLQMRACVFRNCKFEGVAFSKCLMVGVRFEGEVPPDGSMVDCK